MKIPGPYVAANELNPSIALSIDASRDSPKRRPRLPTRFGPGLTLAILVGYQFGSGCRRRRSIDRVRALAARDSISGPCRSGGLAPLVTFAASTT